MRVSSTGWRSISSPRIRHGWCRPRGPPRSFIWLGSRRRACTPAARRIWTGFAPAQNSPRHSSTLAGAASSASAPVSNMTSIAANMRRAVRSMRGPSKRAGLRSNVRSARRQALASPGPGSSIFWAPRTTRIASHPASPVGWPRANPLRCRRGWSNGTSSTSATARGRSPVWPASPPVGHLTSQPVEAGDCAIWLMRSRWPPGIRNCCMSIRLLTAPVSRRVWLAILGDLPRRPACRQSARSIRSIADLIQRFSGSEGLNMTVDDKTKRLIVEDDNGRRELDLYSDQSFDLLSKWFLNIGWSRKYSYGFSWMGRPVIQLPDDMVRIRGASSGRFNRTVIVETGVAHGGSLVFYASLFEAMGRGAGHRRRHRDTPAKSPRHRDPPSC